MEKEQRTQEIRQILVADENPVMGEEHQALLDELHTLELA